MKITRNVLIAIIAVYLVAAVLSFGKWRPAGGPPALWDHIWMLALCILSPLVDLLLFPQLQRSAAAGVRAARPRAYICIIVFSWTLTAVILAQWLHQGRPWSALGIGLGSPVNFMAGVVITTLYLRAVWTQRREMLANPDRLRRLHGSLGKAEALIPHVPSERLCFAAVSVTAGICEELLFRGFALWYVAAWAGPVVAVAVSSVLFGLAHLYLGKAHVGRSALFGGMFALIVLASGSLWPAMVIHAAIDLVAGDLGYRAVTGAA